MTFPNFQSRYLLKQCKGYQYFVMDYVIDMNVVFWIYVFQECVEVQEMGNKKL